MADQFNPNCHHENWQLSSNNSIITKTTGSHQNSAYLTTIAKSGVHKWAFELSNKTVRDYDLLIGIWNVGQHKQEISSNLRGAGKGKFYGLRANHGRATDGEGTERNDYAPKVKTGDVIHMILDLLKLELSFAINDKDCGVCHKLDKSSYVGAICSYSQGDCIKLLSYSDSEYVDTEKEQKETEKDMLKKQIDELKTMNEKLQKDLSEMQNKNVQMTPSENDEKTLELIRKEIDEMRKEMREEINSLKQIILANDKNTNNNNSDTTELSEFLEHKVNLPEYIPFFIRAGFTDLQSVAYVTNDDLKELGCVLMAHRHKILDALRTEWHK